MHPHHSSIGYLSWLALAIAIALWLGVGLFFHMLSRAEIESSERLIMTEQALTQQSTNLHLRALARATSNERSVLEEIAHKDIVELLTTIEQVGTDVGIPLEISGAVSSPTSNPVLPAHVITLTVSMEGTFEQVTRAVALLEVLPVPSAVNTIHLDLVPPESESEQSQRAVWRAVVGTRFLTTFTLSS